MTKFDSIIVLAPGITLEEENISKYKVSDDLFEFRFKAVAKLHQLGQSRFFLVGGPIKDYPQISKPDVMEWILVNRYGLPPTILTKLVSEANTEGNAKKIQEYAKTTDLGTILIISNYWHLLRASNLFSDYTDLVFKTLPAESVVYDQEQDNINSFYSNQKIITSEIKGLSDYYLGQYKSGSS